MLYVIFCITFLLLPYSPLPSHLQWLLLLQLTGAFLLIVRRNAARRLKPLNKSQRTLLVSAVSLSIIFALAEMVYFTR